MVSVIIPTYNRANYIVRAILSVLNQTYKNFEIIVVDDNDPGSEARAELEIIMKKFKKNSKIRYVKHLKNMNGAVARNTGINVANGEYITFLDDDDYFLNTRLEKMVRLLDENRDYDAIYSSSIVTKNKKIIGENLALKSGKMKNELLMNEFSFGTGSNMFFRADAIRKIKGFDESFLRHQDIETMIRFFSVGKLLAVNEYLVVKTQDDRRNEPSMSEYIKVKENYFKSFEKEIEKLTEDEKNKFYKKNYCELLEASIRKNDRNNYDRFISEIKKYGTLGCDEMIRIILLKINNYVKIEKIKYFIKRVKLQLKIDNKTKKQISYYEKL